MSSLSRDREVKVTMVDSSPMVSDKVLNKVVRRFPRGTKVERKVVK